ncbi:DUF6319 family protein [Gordonia sp. ABSL1-1]|uniref:DUF6319 family protein n=1 Tax=Gordonia sp. ABSL1-1 TaxID=3053923 RepID=UPI00257483FC|nr:DUF6319 family protein [Gordonia sp. ABSL1-1]MDL9935990.1 DUF6319 family protein [Gordonia sp. ABSL1-1]
MGGVSARKSTGLTPDDLESLRAGLAAGKRVTVYLREPMPSLDLDAGTSARVVSVDGSTVTVSPKGIDDELPFEADELQKSRPSTTTPSAPRTPKAQPTASPTTPRPAAPKPAPPQASSKPAVTREPSPPARPEEPKSAPAPARTPRRAKSAPAAVSVTITSTGETSWTVSVAHGTKKHGKPTEVTADRVERAIRELGDDTAITAVDVAISSARAAAQKRIEELSVELEAARAALARLDGQAD